MSDFWSKTTVCLITGASQHVGKAVAELLASKLGPNSLLILSSRSKERLEAVKAESFVKNPGLGVELFQWDLKHPDVEVFKSDLIQASLRDAGGPGGFEQAIIIHNAASLGDMGQKVPRNVREKNTVSFLYIPVRYIWHQFYRKHLFLNIGIDRAVEFGRFPRRPGVDCGYRPYCFHL